MRICVAIPALDESDWLLATLKSLAQQDCHDFEVWVCVNQPDEWWECPAKRVVCRNNEATLEALRAFSGLRLHILDRSSRGQGWEPGKGGVGRARRLLMDTVAQASPDSVIVSLDADTQLDSNYLSSIGDAVRRLPEASGISAPYFHRLVSEPGLDRAVLRYEIYLRYYAVNLWRIGSPYAFTAMGSALACSARSYQRVAGIAPRAAGEDFYFLQKLVKAGRLLHWLPARAYPGTRRSSRVPFGTGAALSSGPGQGWARHPVFSCGLFDDVKATVDAFPVLFRNTVVTPLSEFLETQLGSCDPWEPLRRTHLRQDRFIRACHERLDGLRIFQYLRSRHAVSPGTDETNLFECLRQHYCDRLGAQATTHAYARVVQTLASGGRSDWTFADADLSELDAVRLCLQNIEDEYRKEDAEGAYRNGDSRT